MGIVKEGVGAYMGTVRYVGAYRGTVREGEGAYTGTVKKGVPVGTYTCLYVYTKGRNRGLVEV